uniref:Uncharacterized protein n=1 Tax=Nelumbo nucifera TaxID=4432 RepID=A0A822XRM9_NELNU|nr:TPA_asm: hypothetical protein HUJ06_022898 [Nelumbo nucifera]
MAIKELHRRAKEEEEFCSSCYSAPTGHEIFSPPFFVVCPSCLLCPSISLSLFLIVSCSSLLLVRRREILERENGGLGFGGYSGGVVRAVDVEAIVPATGKEQNSRVREHANKWCIHSGACHHLFRSHHHLPHRHRCSHLHRLITTLFFFFFFRWTLSISFIRLTIVRLASFHFVSIPTSKEFFYHLESPRFRFEESPINSLLLFLPLNRTLLSPNFER